jgi:hypothetical protein
MRSLSPVAPVATDKSLLKKDDPKELLEILNKVPLKQLKEWPLHLSDGNSHRATYASPLFAYFWFKFNFYSCLDDKKVDVVLVYRLCLPAALVVMFRMTRPSTKSRVAPTLPILEAPLWLFRLLSPQSRPSTPELAGMAVPLAVTTFGSNEASDVLGDVDVEMSEVSVAGECSILWSLSLTPYCFSSYQEGPQACGTKLKAPVSEASSRKGKKREM